MGDTHLSKPKNLLKKSQNWESGARFPYFGALGGQIHEICDNFTNVKVILEAIHAFIGIYLDTNYPQKNIH